MCNIGLSAMYAPQMCSGAFSSTLQIVNFPFRGMSRISASPVLLKVRIISFSGTICHVMLLLWLRMLWLEVDLTTVTPCLGVSQLLIVVSCNVFKIVWLEMLPTSLSIHTSLLLGRLSTGCLLNTVPYLRLPSWCTNSYIVVIPNNLSLSLNLDMVFITCKSQADGVFLMAPHFTTSVYKYISLLSILASALLMMLQRFGMICLMMYVRPLLSILSERSISTITFPFPSFSPWH